MKASPLITSYYTFKSFVYIRYKLLFICVILFFCMTTVYAQQKMSMKDYEKSKKEYEEMMKTMDPEERKEFEQMLKSMGIDLNRAIKVTENSLDGKVTAVRKKTSDPEDISKNMASLTVAVTPQNKTQLTDYLSPIFTETDKLIKPESKNSVKKLLNKGEMTGKYAMLFWANKELDKALYLLLNASITNPDDQISINNLGTLLTISGYAHKSLPILLYIQKLLPANSTVANNVGQAYLSLGDVDKANAFLLASVKNDSTNVEAYRSLALIAKKQGKPAEQYIEKIVENDGGTNQNITLLEEMAPKTDKSRGYQRIRNRYRPFYKDHSITKRFIAPDIPNSYGTAIATYSDITAFFADLKMTIQEAQKAKPDAESQMKESYDKHLAQFQKIANNIGKPGTAEMAQNLKNNLVSPLMNKANFMLSAMNDPRYSVSYTDRKQRERESRQKKEEQLKVGLKSEFDDKIDELKKEIGTLDIGEGGKDNKRLMQLENEICLLRTARQQAWLSRSAEINNYYIRNMEKLLNQELQERLFWYTLATQTLGDPTPMNYEFYIAYLGEIADFESLYHKETILTDRCDANTALTTRKGKLKQWEREHCEVEMGFDAVVAGGKFDCTGFTVYGTFKFAEITYSRSYEPVYWETTGHSITVKVGADKDFAVGKKLGGKVGVSGEGTIRLNENMNIEDWVVKASAGVSVNDGNSVHSSGGDGEVIGSLGADIGSVSISANGGFNTSGPGFTGLGSGFLK